MRIFWDTLLILTILVWVLKLAIDGYIPAKWAAIILISLVFFIAVGRVGGSISRLIRLTFRIALPIASLILLSIVLGAGSIRGTINIFLTILPLLIALIGFYVMFGGLFSKKK